MNESSQNRVSAEVIPFPTPIRAEPPRIVRSLEGLQQALQEQRAAIATWRHSLAELRTALTTLGNSLQSTANNYTK